jgi:BirA family biotin operon repressor/biotin-[acetyl-CoA-carboxylase] ligase
MAPNGPERLNSTEPEARPLQLSQIRNGLSATRLGKKLHYLLEVDSTNTHARRLAENGAAEGEIIIAERQTHGRGRLGRSWFSPPYVNLHLSIVLRPKLPPMDAPQITLMAAVALADTIASFVSHPTAIKWPNDILIQGKKLAGILTESSLRSDRIDFVILGIGVNLNFPRARMPDGIRDRATSVMEFSGEPVNREAFLRRLIHDLERCYGILEETGFDAIASRWNTRFALRGKKVRVEMMNEVFSGTARGIDRDGALLVGDDLGQIRRVIAGDVIPLED